MLPWLSSSVHTETNLPGSELMTFHLMSPVTYRLATWRLSFIALSGWAIEKLMISPYSDSGSSIEVCYIIIPRSGVRIATRYRVRFLTGPRAASRPTLGLTRVPHRWVPVALSAGIKRPWRETDYSPSSSAEVKNGGAAPPFLHTSWWRGA
jgi:hypothetical protein